MILPTEVPHGRPVSDLTQAVNMLIRYCRSITPRPSASVGVSSLPNGTTFQVKVSGSRKSAPFAAYEDYYAFAAKITEFDSDRKTYSIFYRGGSAQVAGGKITFFPAATIDDVAEDTWCWLERLKKIDKWSMKFGDEPPERANSLPADNEEEEDEEEEGDTGEGGGEEGSGEDDGESAGNADATVANRRGEGDDDGGGAEGDGGEGGEGGAGEDGGEGSGEDGQETDLVVPLWHFKYDKDGAGYLTQYSSGAVYLPCVVNVLDVDIPAEGSGGEGGDGGGEAGGEGGDEEYDPDHPFGPDE